MQLNDIRMRDPFILRTPNDAYVLFGTTDPNLWGGPGTGFDCYVSDDLVEWNGPISAFRPPTDYWGTTQFWAPEVHAYRDAFYMFATFAHVADGDLVRGTAILKSPAPTGPFAPWSDGPVTPIDLPCLDGTFYVDENEQPWIVYSRGAEGTKRAPALSDGEMYALKLTPDLRAAVGDPVLLFTSSSAPWSRPFKLPPGVPPHPDFTLAEDPLFTDGAFLFRTPDGSLRMLWSACAEVGYAMGIATSESGSLLGPWTQTSTPLWDRNGGHGMVIEEPVGAPKLVFHAPNETPDERVVMIDVEYSPDGLRLS